MTLSCINVLGEGTVFDRPAATAPNHGRSECWGSCLGLLGPVSGLVWGQH